MYVDFFAKIVWHLFHVRTRITYEFTTVFQGSIIPIYESSLIQA